MFNSAIDHSLNLWL